ncbi:MAG: hypothetical protein ABI183_10315 [Polyangiaceae bacterium]
MTTRIADPKTKIATATTAASVHASQARSSPCSAVSQAWLRVSMTLNPTTDKFGTPTVTAWRQSYDCVDSQ